MNLPSPIQIYFDADGKTDGEAPMAAFAMDAVVEDEGKKHRGCDAIQSWWRDAKAKNQHRAKPFAIADEGDTIKVRARVSGNFAGSPADLTFAFRLKDDAIVGLRIGA